MASSRPSPPDLVDVVGAVGGFLGRHPFTSAIVLSEAVFLAAAHGVLPDVVSMVLGFPTYIVHILLVRIGGGVWWRGLAVALGATVLLEVALGRLGGRRGAV